MQLSESFRIALGSLRSHRVRSFLTMLGIIIGVASVITVFAMGRGAEKATKESIERYGTNLLSIRAAFGRSMLQRAGGVGARLYNQDVDDVRKLGDVVAAVPETWGNTQAKYGSNVWQTRVVGTTPEYEWVRNTPLSEGKYFSNTDNARRERVALIGMEVKKNLFGDGAGPVVGREIKVRGLNFRVIGVIKEKGPGWFSPDDMILVPLMTAQKRLFGNDYLTAVSVKVGNLDQLNPVSLEIEKLLRRNHKLYGETPNDFMIQNQIDLIETYKSTTDTFKWLLGSIAGVSLVVGGIGIMNIMLVSVTERTREIGLRMAIGARKRDIRLQFLIEAVALSILGGAVGILVGSGASGILSHFYKWNTLIAGDSVLLAFGFAAVVGIVFGYYPAWKASHLDPIESLRYE